MSFRFTESAFCFTAMAGEDAGTVPPLDVTNVQKLGLSPSTAVGTRVSVSDGFVVSASATTEANSFYFPNGTNSGKPQFYRPGLATVACQWDGSNWLIFDNSASVVHGATEDVDFPWQVTTWYDVDGVTPSNPQPVLTHPAIQTLAAASTAQGGVVVLGGTQDGVYTDTGATFEGRNVFMLLGQTDTDPNNGDSALSYWNGSRWFITDFGGAGIYYSLSDVATPDLVTNIPCLSNTAAFFKFDTGLGTPLYDYSGNGNNFTVDGAVSIVAGKHGNALEFSGIGQQIETGDSGSFSSNGAPFAIWMWIKRPVASLGDLQWLARAGDDFELIWGIDNKIRFGVPNTPNTDNGTYVTTTAAVSSDDTWHLVMAWYDGTDWNLQIDNGTPVSGALGTPTGGDGTMNLAGAGGGFTLFAGTMDSVGLRNATLSSGDRTALWNSGNGVDYGTNWKNAADDSPATITVTSVSVGEIYAGLVVTNDGVTNGSSYVSQPFHGRQYYMGLNGGGSNNMHWDTDFNVWTDDVGVWTTDNVAFPWQGTDAHTGHNGATFSRNDVANPANWQ